MYSDLIDLAYQIINHVHCQSYHEASLLITSLTNTISNSRELSSLLVDPESEFNYIFSSLSESLNNKDYILLADTLEDLFIPYIKSIIVYPSAYVYKDYSFEPSSSGLLTVKHIPSNTYLHSNCNPFSEARSMINFYFDENKTEYAVYGLGLGYHIKALSDISMGAINIFVYENDCNLINYVKENNHLNLYSLNNLHIIHDPLGDLFLQKIEVGNCGSIFHYPSIKKITNKELRSSFIKFYAIWNSYYQQKKMIKINFIKNCLNCSENIFSESEKFRGKNVYIVAGGPSTDQNLDLLKKLSSSENIILSVTTVLKKLILSGIVPNYAVVMDAYERTYGHMRGIEDCTVPLIIDSAAYWKFSENHKGPKYLALQNGYEPAEQLAAKYNYPLFDTFGTVTTLALDVAIKFKARNIYLIGVDLSFPGGKSHAKGTLTERTVDTSELIPINDVNGNTIYTDEVFLGYLTSIENMIQNHPEIKFYNLSTIGAKIKGTICP